MVHVGRLEVAVCGGCLEDIYNEVPELECKRLCADYCTTGPIPMGKIEWERVKKHLGSSPKGDTKTWVCPMLDGTTCTVHAVRPLICRLWGAARGMECPHGCKPKRWVEKDEGHALLKQVYSLDGIVYDLWGEDAYKKAKGIMKLSVKERLLLTGVLPPEGDLVTLRNVQALKLALAFSDAEIDRWNIRIEGDRANWDLLDANGQPLDQDVELELTPKQRELIRAELDKKNKAKQLKIEQLSLCEKFEVE